MSNCCCHNDEGVKKIDGKNVASAILILVLGIISLYFTFSMFKIYEMANGMESAPYLLVSCILNALLCVAYFAFGTLALINKCKCLCPKGFLTFGSLAFAGISGLDTVLIIVQSGSELTGVAAVISILQLLVYVAAVVLLVLSFVIHQHKKLFRIVGNGLLLGYVIFIVFNVLGAGTNSDVVSNIMYFVYIAYFVLQILSYLGKHECAEETCCCENDNEYYLSALDEEEQVVNILSGYQDLLERKAITQEEFDEIKKQLFGE